MNIIVNINILRNLFFVFFFLKSVTEDDRWVMYISQSGLGRFIYLGSAWLDPLNSGGGFPRLSVVFCQC